MFFMKLSYFHFSRNFAQLKFSLLISLKFFTNIIRCFVLLCKMIEIFYYFLILLFLFITLGMHINVNRNETLSWKCYVFPIKLIVISFWKSEKDKKKFRDNKINTMFGTRNTKFDRKITSISNTSISINERQSQLTKLPSSIKFNTICEKLC